MGSGEGERIDGWTGQGERAADPGDMNSDSGLFLRLVKCLPPQSTAQLASLADFFYAVSLRFSHFFPHSGAWSQASSEERQIIICPRLPSAAKANKCTKKCDPRSAFVCILVGVAMFTVYRIPFAPARKPYRIGLLFTNNNGDLCVISVTDRCCLAPI